MNKRTKELNITQKTKEMVFKRDNGKCVICGSTVNIMPNSHYIKRSRGGLGIEQNVFTACTNFTENKCHQRWEHHQCTDEEIKKVIDNFKLHYHNWNENDLYYKKKRGN